MSIVTSPAIVQGRTVLGPCSNRTVPPSCSTCLERSQPPSRDDFSMSVIETPGANLLRYHAADRPVIPPPAKLDC